jgi:hypothetical protein
VQIAVRTPAYVFGVRKHIRLDPEGSGLNPGRRTIVVGHES